MEGEGAGTLALDETNLIIRAARALAQRTRVPAHARLHLRKTIPLAAVGANTVKIQQMLDRVGFK